MIPSLHIMCLVNFNPKLSYCVIRERQKRSEGHDSGLIRGQRCPRGPIDPWPLMKDRFRGLKHLCHCI